MVVYRKYKSLGFVNSNSWQSGLSKMRQSPTDKPIWIYWWNLIPSQMNSLTCCRLYSLVASNPYRTHTHDTIQSQPYRFQNNLFCTCDWIRYNGAMDRWLLYGEKPVVFCYFVTTRKKSSCKLLLFGLKFVEHSENSELHEQFKQKFKLEDKKNGTLLGILWLLREKK